MLYEIKMRYKLIDHFSLMVAGIAFLVALLIYFTNTQEFWGSLVAAILTSALAWIAYVLTRLIYLALKK